MITLEEIKKSFLVSLWFVFLTFPIMVIRVNTIYNRVEWRWENMLFVGVGSFFLSFLWRYLLRRKEMGGKTNQAEETKERIKFKQRLMEDRRVYLPLLAAILVFAAAYPFIFSMYQTNIMINALIL